MAEEWIYGFHAVEAALEEGRVLEVMVDSARKDKRMQSFLT